MRAKARVHGSTQQQAKRERNPVQPHASCMSPTSATNCSEFLHLVAKKLKTSRGEGNPPFPSPRWLFEFWKHLWTERPRYVLINGKEVAAHRNAVFRHEPDRGDPLPWNGRFGCTSDGSNHPAAHCNADLKALYSKAGKLHSTPGGSPRSSRWQTTLDAGWVTKEQTLTDGARVAHR